MPIRSELAQLARRSRTGTTSCGRAPRRPARPRRSANSRTVRADQLVVGRRGRSPSRAILTAAPAPRGGGSARGGSSGPRAAKRLRAYERASSTSSRTPKPVAPLSKYGRPRSQADAGDVEVRPRRVAGEVVQERSAPTIGSPRGARARCQVGVAALDHLGVLLVQRQPPDELAGARPAPRASAPPRSSSLAHQAGVRRAERDDHRAGERRQVDDPLRTPRAGRS